MSRGVISLSLAVLFVVFLTAPTIIALVDDSIDISMIYNTSEEDDKGSEKNKEIEVLYTELNHNLNEVFCISNKNYTGYSFSHYPKPHLNLISPPPENIY